MNKVDLGFSSDLPIFERHEAIVAAVDANQVTIITAETGAGKSTQVPQYLAEHGYKKVIVTQPRILAARNLCNRVREEWAMRTGKDGDDVIGYRTAHERDDKPDTQILYCTDGLQLVRELTGSGVKERQVLVLDEVHEWNENMEVLVAWAKRRCQEDPRFKVVIMSATIEVASLATFFGATAIVSVPGRGFEVTKRRGKDVVTEIIIKIEARQSNILVFLPGKAEIESVTAMIQTKALAAAMPIIPLHSQLEATSQQQAFASYPHGKVILATNIAQTSVTIDDIDVVIDSGLERRSEVRDGVEGLFIAQISQADCLQRAGRAGRTKKGEYILARLDAMPCLDFADRPPYGTPEILRKHIDRVTLRLAAIDIDIELLEFYHAPSRRARAQAKRTLMALGALTGRGEVTEIGRRMERFPVESSYARMLVEAEQYPKELQAKLVAIISIQEIGGIIKGGVRYTDWRRLTRQTKSDLLAQYDVYRALPAVDLEAHEDMGIISKNVSKAAEVMERLNRDLGLVIGELLSIVVEDTTPLLKAIIAGQIDQLWVVAAGGMAMHVGSGQTRELSSGTVVLHPRLVVGTPFDLQVPLQSGGLETLHLVQGITSVEPRWLEEMAPQLFKLKPGKLAYDSQEGRLVMRQMIVYNGHTIEADVIPVTEHTKRNGRLFSDLLASWLYEQLERQRRDVTRIHGYRAKLVPLRQLQQQVQAITQGKIALDELSATQRAEVRALAKIETHQRAVNHTQHIPHRQGDRHHVSRRRPWQPSHKRRYERER
jgi:HrpA-like RNA helicase